MDHPLTLLPLGGLGEIGMNGLVLNWKGDRWLIDCGVMFGDDTLSSVDLVLPDLRFFREHKDSFKGMILTHGHEDHIGAVPYVLKEVMMPLYASKFTHGLIARRLEEHGLSGRVDQRILEPSMGSLSPPESPDLGFSFIRVTHSIPDAASLLIETPVGRVLHTADFKIDDHPIDGQAFDAPRFRKLGDDGVLLLLSDSTNAQVPGKNRSEREVIDALEQQVRDWPGRVLITQFASNLHRLRGIQEVAQKTGRKLCLLGRSLYSYSDIARDNDLQSIDPTLLVSPEHLNEVDPERLIVVLTGSQGEGRAALNRAAQGKHPQLKMGPGDLILWSARFIPGNERRIWRMINSLSRLGVRVVHPLAAQIHTSGHARQDELRTMIELIRPKHFIPVHGEYAFLVDHAKLAQDSGVTSTLIVHNGQEVAVKPGADLQVIKEHTLDTFFVDGSVTAEADELNLADKRKMFMNGVVVAQVSASASAGDPQVNVSLKSRGIFTDDGRLLNLARDFVRDELLTLSPDEFTRSGIEEVTRIFVRRFFKKQIGKKPLVVSFVNKAGG